MRQKNEKVWSKIKQWCLWSLGSDSKVELWNPPPADGRMRCWPRYMAHVRVSVTHTAALKVTASTLVLTLAGLSPLWLYRLRNHFKQREREGEREVHAAETVTPRESREDKYSMIDRGERYSCVPLTSSRWLLPAPDLSHLSQPAQDTDSFHIPLFPHLGLKLIQTLHLLSIRTNRHLHKVEKTSPL